MIWVCLKFNWPCCIFVCYIFIATLGVSKGESSGSRGQRTRRGKKFLSGGCTYAQGDRMLLVGIPIILVPTP